MAQKKFLLYGLEIESELLLREVLLGVYSSDDEAIEAARSFKAGKAPAPGTYDKFILRETTEDVPSKQKLTHKSRLPKRIGPKKP